MEDHNRRRTKISKTVKIIVNTFEWIVFVALLIVFIILLSPLLPTKKYVYTYVVASGSMEPTIHTGAVAFVEPVTGNAVLPGDIITFTNPNNPKETVIHRVVGSIKTPRGIAIQTKGDANQVADNWQLDPSLIKGKYLSSIPYLGIAALSIRTKVGFAFYIGVPALLLLLLQFKKIKEGIEEEIQRRTKKAVEEIEKHDPFKMGIVLVLLGLFGSLYAAHHITVAHAIFSTTATVMGIQLQTADHFAQTPEVIFNEIMWSGSTTSDKDIWIELKNTTNHTIDLSNWQIINAVGGHGHVEIPANFRVPSNSYFLITHFDADNAKSALHVNSDLTTSSLQLNTDYQTNGALILKDKQGDIIDQTPIATSSAWPAGTLDSQNNLHQSMERNDASGSSGDLSKWHTCTDGACTSTLYWDTSSINYGTPGGENK